MCRGRRGRRSSRRAESCGVRSWPTSRGIWILAESVRRTLQSAILHRSETRTSDYLLFDQALSYLHCLECRAFQKLIAADEKVYRVRIANIVADVSGEHIELTSGFVRHWEAISFAVVNDFYAGEIRESFADFFD